MAVKESRGRNAFCFQYLKRQALEGVQLWCMKQGCAIAEELEYLRDEILRIGELMRALLASNMASG